MDRKEAIENLKGLQKLVTYNQQNFDALEMAINSLEVDEAYQLEYEKVDAPPERRRNTGIKPQIFKCLKCGTVFAIYESPWINCPNCGSYRND